MGCRVCSAIFWRSSRLLTVMMVCWVGWRGGSVMCMMFSW